MSPQPAAAAARALHTRTPIVLLHVAGVRGVGAVALGFRAVFEPVVGLTASFGDNRLDARIAADAAETLRVGEPRAQVYAPDGGPATRRAAAYLRVFYDPILPTPRLVIVGAGHVAQPLAGLASILGLEVTVIDDRSDYANRSRFPTAVEIVAAPIGPTLNELSIDPATYIVLVTRAHRFDEEALRRVLRSPAPYIGMIGSRRRVHIVYQTLLAEGVPQADFRRLYAPIGLDIGAQTPAEIALAIVSELVNLRRGGRARHLSLAEFRPNADTGEDAPPDA